MIAAIKERMADHVPNPYLVTIAVSIATFMEVLDTTITNVSLSHIAGELGASSDESTWVLTSYLVANAIVLPISGWLADVIGRKRFFMMCIAGFTLASFACGAATSLPMLIVFRLLQGLAGGGLQPVQQAIVMDSFPPEKRGTAFALTGFTTIIAPVLGPTLGGYITDSYSWRWIFYLNIPFGIFALGMVAFLVRDHVVAHKTKAIDYVGLSLVALGIGALQIVLDKGQQDDWFNSSFIVVISLISFLSLVSAVIWLLGQENPIIELSLLKKKAFALPCLSMFCVGMALYSSSALLPILVESQFGYDAFLAGLVLSPGAVILLVMMPLSGKLVTKFQPKYMIAFGFTMCALGMWYTSHVTPQVDYMTFVLMRTVQVMGLPFLFVPVSTLAFSDIPKHMSNKASAIFSLSRNIGGSIGIALVSSYVSTQKQVHQNAFSNSIISSDPIYQGHLASYVQVVKDAGYSSLQAGRIGLSRMYGDMQGQITVLAYNDAFLLISYIMVGLALMAVFFMPKRKKAVASTEEPMAGMH
jgi:DHA2 family multidrug resistance protein